MRLEDIYLNMDYSRTRSPIKEVLEKIILIDFQRNKTGRIQHFCFTFIYKEKSYTLQHSTWYHCNGVEHWFKVKKPLLSRRPFSLSRQNLINLSDELMKPVNTWTLQTTENK